jgi:hypothetical protein
MILQPAGLEATELDAFQTDRYLDALLSAAERRAGDVPADPAVDPTLRLAARRLRDELVRTHPSFRFEERLAGRLAEAAARMRLATAAGGEAEAAIIPFPAPLLADPGLAAELANPELAALLGARYAAVQTPGDAAGERVRGAIPAAPGVLADPGVPVARADTSLLPFRPVLARPLLVRGALTSAALSLAGAAFVAWRLTRGAPTDPMARAVRAARAAREAAVATATEAGTASAATDGAFGRRRLA